MKDTWILLSSLMLKTLNILYRTGCRCASSPGLGVNLAIKHERVKSSAEYADGTIQAEKEMQRI